MSVVYEETYSATAQLQTYGLSTVWSFNVAFTDVPSVTTGGKRRPRRSVRTQFPPAFLGLLVEAFDVLRVDDGVIVDFGSERIVEAVDAILAPDGDVVGLEERIVDQPVLSIAFSNARLRGKREDVVFDRPAQEAALWEMAKQLAAAGEPDLMEAMAANEIGGQP